MTDRARPLHTWGFAVAALLLAIVSGVVIDGAIRFSDDARRLNSSQHALNALGNLLSNQRDAIAAQRGFLLGVGDPERSRYLRAVERLQLDLGSLNGLVEQGTVPAADLAALREALGARLGFAALVVEQFERGGLEAAQQILRDGRSADLDAGIEQRVELLLQTQRAAQDAQTRTFERSSQRLLVTASLGIPLSLMILGVIYLLLRNEIDVRRNAEQVAADWHAELNSSVEQMSRVSRDMQRLSAYASLLQTSDNTDEALDITQVSLSALLPECAGTVYLLGEDDEEARVATQWGEHRASSSAQPAPHDCWALRRSQPFATDPTTAELRCQHIESGAAAKQAATLCIPLSVQGETLGLLYLSGPPPMQGQALAETAAEQLSLALGNLRLRDKLRHQSTRDPLTGLFNRRYLDEALLRELARCQRKAAPLAVMMIDVDFFKKFNDSHGHPGGDALLAAVGKLMRQQSRAGDIPCRYGGEEFTLLLPETDAVSAQAVAEKLRLAIEAMSVVHEGKTLSKVTASMGIAVLPDSASSIEALLEAADAALYQAKSEGRNRVRLAPALHAGSAPIG